MKKYFKKLVSLLCVLTLCVGTMHITAKAVDTYSGTLSVTGAQITTKTTAYIYLKGTDTYLSGNGEDWESSAVKLNASADDAASGIFVNGEKQSGGLLKRYNGTNNYYLAEGFTATTAGDVVTIKGTFYSQDGAAAVTYEEAHFLWNGTQWVDCYKGKLTIEGAAVTNNTDLTKFYIQGTDGYTVGKDWADTTMMPATDDAASGIFVDGTRIDNYYSAQASNEGNAYVRLRKWSDSGNDYYIESIPNVATGSIVTIQGTFYVYNGWLESTYDTTPVVFEKSQFMWNGSTWIDCYAGKLTIEGAIVTNNTDSTKFYIQGTDGYKTGSDSWPEVTMKPATDDTGSGVFVDGTRIENYYSANTGETGYVRLRKISDSGIDYYIENIPNVTTGSVVTIKGTFYVYSNWLETNKYDSTPIVFEKSSFKWNGTQWEDYDGLAEYSGTLTTVGAETNNDNSALIYLKGSDEYLKDNTEAWTGLPEEKLVADSTDSDSGIWLNDTKQTDAFLKKYSGSNNLYLAESFSSTPSTGAVVKIKGTFYSQDGLSAVTFEENEFQWDGSNWVEYVEIINYPGTLTYTTGAGSATYVYLDTTDTMPTISWDTKLYALNDESGIYINGTKNAEAFMKRPGASSYYVENFGTLNAGDILKIKGLFGYSANNETVSFDEAQFRWTGSVWENYVELAQYSGTLTTVGAETNNDNSALIYLKGSDEYLKDNTEAWTGLPEEKLVADSTDSDSGIWLNDTKQTDAFLKKYSGSNNLYLAESFSSTPSTGAVVKIKGTFYSQDGLSAVTFEENEFQWNGSKWVDYVETINYPGALTYESGDATHMYLTGTDEKPTTSWDNQLKALNGESGIYVNGTKKEDAYLKKYAAYKYYIAGFDTVVEGAELTVKGLFGVSGEYETVTIEEVTFRYEGNCWVDTANITSYEEGTLWLDTNSPNTAINLYLRGSIDLHENCSPDDYPAFGWETTVGTTGFYKNDVACSGNLKNVANGGGWYLGLEGAGITEGDKLTIKGTYGYNGRYVKFAEYNLWYTGGKWVITPAITADTKLYGDSNGDAALDSRDIVRLKRYLADQPVSVYSKHNDGSEVHKTGADANGVDGINDRDRLKTYELILEGAKYVVGGSYTVSHYPVYLDDEDIKLGAYHGPRMSGKQDYTYSDGTLSSTTVSTSFLNTAEFTKYKNAGLNTLLHEVDGPYSSKTAGLGYGVDDGNFQNYLRLAKEAGLGVYITSMGLNSYVKFEGAGDGATSIDFNGDGTLSSTAITIDETKYGWDYNGDGTISSSAQMTEIFYYSDSIKNAAGMTILEADIREVLEYIVKNGYEEIFKGFAMPDEPWLTGQTRYQSAVTLINELAAEYGLDIAYQGCVYPSYAESDQIGDNYATYINGFGTAAGNLMYDFYPLQNTKKWYQSSFTNSLNAAWLTNLQTVATQGKANNYTTGITLQSCGYEFNADTGWLADESYRRDPSSDADMQFQVYSALAFGMKQINYFTYWEHPNQSSDGEQFTSSMVQYPASGGTESVTTDIYTYVQNANNEITKFDHIFMDYDWQGTITAGSSDLFSGLASYSTDKVTVNSSTGSAIVSHMYDSEKNLDGYWLVNVAEPSGSSTATVNVTFTDMNKAMVFINGEQQIVDLTGGVYNATLAVGEGIFIIPLNIQ